MWPLLHVCLSLLFSFHLESEPTLPAEVEKLWRACKEGDVDTLTKLLQDLGLQPINRQGSYSTTSQSDRPVDSSVHVISDVNSHDMIVTKPSAASPSPANHTRNMAASEGTLCDASSSLTGEEILSENLEPHLNNGGTRKPSGQSLKHELHTKLHTCIIKNFRFGSVLYALSLP